MSDHLRDLAHAGVSIWLDDLDRGRLAGGGLAELVRDSSVTGVTTNPSIFEKAISAGSASYAEQIHELALRGVDAVEAVRAMTAFDVRWACDILEPTYERTSGRDGWVSIEVDPRLARDTEATVAEAKALQWTVDRRNLLVKIPATREGLPAIAAVLAEGISVNATLIFSVERYEEVLDAWLSGLERARANGHDVTRIGSVASFFVSRVDTEVDRRLGGRTPMNGTAAIANARLAYEVFSEARRSERCAALEEAGAQVQRPLWASTGVKDPAYEDTRYVSRLALADTVNTMPEATLDAVRDHGELRVDAGAPSYAAARQALDALAAAGVDLDDVAATLEAEGVEKFVQSWTNLLDAVDAALAGAREKAGR